MSSLLHEGIYRVIECCEDRVVIELCDATHPVFQAHFEGNPLLPGYMQIDIIASIFGKVVDTISSTKYMKPILPESRITYHIKVEDPKVSITIKNSEGEKVSIIKMLWSDC